MKISFDKYPVDIILCILVSLLVLPIALLNLDQTLRIILGLPFILFIPGYILIFALFPTKKTDRGIDTLERIALSFGLSIAVVPLIGLILNYTPWGIELKPILLSLFGFILIVGFVGIYRWMNTDPDERFTISLDVALPKSENKLDKALTIVLIITILIAVASLVYVVVTPKTGETFTEFSILGPYGKATDYPRNLTMGENATVILGIVNHEYRQITYTIEVWLVNQSMVYNASTQENETIYHNLWFMDKITIALNYTIVNTEQPWAPQGEYNYTFSVNRTGSFKLAFLLFTTPTDDYHTDEDYHTIAAQKITSAYRSLHLWIDVVSEG